MADSNLDLGVGFTYEVDVGDLDHDSKADDLLLCNFYLFNPPLPPDPAAAGSPSLYYPVEGSGGLRLFINVGGESVTESPLQGETSAYTTTSAQVAGSAYLHPPASMVDLSERIDWNGLVPPSVRDAEIADLNNDDRMDILLSCGVGVDVNKIDLSNWQNSGLKSHIAQDRILIQDENGIFRDLTFGEDGIPDQGPNADPANDDRLPENVRNSCGVSVGDIVPAPSQSDPIWLDAVIGHYGANFTGEANSILRNNGDGYFTLQTPSNVAQVQRPTADVEIGDLDDDGDLDYVVANANPFAHEDPNQNYSNEIWLNNGDGTFTLAPCPDPFDVTPIMEGTAIGPDVAPHNGVHRRLDCRSVALCDIDNDDDLDIFFANSGWLGPNQHNAIYPAVLPNFEPLFGVTTRLRGLVPQLLLNMGNDQDNVPGAGLNDYWDVTFVEDDPGMNWSVFPWARLPFELSVISLGLRFHEHAWPAMQDAEFADMGSPCDLSSTVNKTSPPDTDGFADLFVGCGPYERNMTLINNGDWSMQEVLVHGENGQVGSEWRTRGRFLLANSYLVDPVGVCDVGGSSSTIAGGHPYWAKDGNAGSLRWPPEDHNHFRIKAHDFYTHDIDVADLDGDGAVDVVTADGDPFRGDTIAMYLFRTMLRGFRWDGPSDEGALLPDQNNLLAYGARAADLDGDDDLDLVIPGVPTALVFENLLIDETHSPSSTGYSEGKFRFMERTFGDKLNQLGRKGYLPFTGTKPLYAPLLLETVEIVDLDQDGKIDIVAGGYPFHDDVGQAFPQVHNEALDWHSYSPFQTSGDDPPSLGVVYPTFYLKGLGNSEWEEVTLSQNPTYFDTNGRDYQNISDRIRSADFDNDGDPDLIVGYRFPSTQLWPGESAGTGSSLPPGATDWETGQVALSLFINEEGRLKDEVVERLFEYRPDCDGVVPVPPMYTTWAPRTEPGLSDTQGPIPPGDYLAGMFIECIAFGDIEDDGDIDILLGGRRQTQLPNAPGLDTHVSNVLLLNLGGPQPCDSVGPGCPDTFRPGNFRVIGPDQLPEIGPQEAFHTARSIVACDIDADDRIDFAMTGHDTFPSNPNHGFTIVGVVEQTDQAGNPTPVDACTGLPHFERLELGTGFQTDAWVNGPDWEPHMGIAVDDFNDDGWDDVFLSNNAGKYHRLLLNTGGPTVSGEGPDHLLVDVTASGPILPGAGPGTAAPQGIDWVPGWSIGVIVAEDFDGNGVSDVYVPNFDRAGQDDLFLATADPVGLPRLTRIEPLAGAITGSRVVVRGTNFDSTVLSQITIGKGSVEVPIVPYSGSTSRRFEFDMPANAPMGTVHIKIPDGVGGHRKHTLTHLNAAPTIEVCDPVPQDYQHCFVVRDADGFLDIDLNDAIIRFFSPGVQVPLVLNGYLEIAQFADVWFENDAYYMATDLAFLPGTKIELEVDDSRRALGRLTVEY